MDAGRKSGTDKVVVKEIAELRKELVQLHRRVRNLEEAMRSMQSSASSLVHPVVRVLAQRGLPVLHHGDLTQVLVPSPLSEASVDWFYNLLRRYSFRLFLRDVIHYRESADAFRINRYCSSGTVRKYLSALDRLGMVERRGSRGFRLLSHQVSSFGPTLEWYVHRIMEKEFLAPSLFAVRLGRTQHGGDYDVIALIRDRLVYVEVKSSPPRGVEIQAVHAFLRRLEDLQPGLALFLVDTELRMKDKIVELFKDALASRKPGTGVWPVERLCAELFHIRHGIYMVNSRRGIYSNLRVCLRDHFRWEREAALPF